MKSKMIKGVIIFLLLLASTTLFCQNKEILKYEDYIKTIKEKLAELKMNESKELIAKNTLFKSYSLHDVDWKGSFSTTYNKYYWDDEDDKTTDNNIGFTTGTSLSTTIPSGTNITLGVDYAETNSQGDYSEFSMAKMTTIEGTYSNLSRTATFKAGIVQPLINNWFGFLDRYAKKDARMNLEIAKLKRIENDKATLNYYKKLYYMWIQYLDILKLLEKTIANARTLEKQTEQKFKSGVAEADDLERVKYSLYKYQDQYLSQRSRYREIVNELSLYFDVENLIPERKDLNNFYQTSFNNEIKYIPFEDTRNSEVLNLTRDNLEYRKKASFNRTLPQFNIYGNLEVPFHMPQNTKTPDDDYEDEDETISTPTYREIKLIAGLEFRYSLGNHQAIGAYKEMELLLKEFEYQYEITLRDYNKGMKNLISNIETLKRIIDLKEKSIAALNKQHTTERRKYTQARLELRYLLDTENSITNEEIEILQAKINLINYYLEYLKLTE